ANRNMLEILARRRLQRHALPEVAPDLPRPPSQMDSSISSERRMNRAPTTQDSNRPLQDRYLARGLLDHRLIRQRFGCQADAEPFETGPAIKAKHKTASFVIPRLACPSSDSPPPPLILPEPTRREP